MIVVIQRVKKAAVIIGDQAYSKISKGLLVLVGIENEDAAEDIEWLTAKIAGLRIFNDRKGVMNLSILDDGGDILVVSQFTLHASTRKGNRPSYLKAANADIAIPLYEKFISALRQKLRKEIYTGKFGADMMVDLINDGPVTIIIDTKNKS